MAKDVNEIRDVSNSSERTNCIIASNIWNEILTGEVDGKARLGDIKVSLELNGDDVESRMDPFRQQRAANLLQ